MQRPIHVWTPGIRDDAGGIQAFSRFFVRALREGLPDYPMRVFVRNESLPSTDLLLSQGIDFHSFEALPSSVRSPGMAAVGTWYGLRERPVCTLSTHLHFFPAMRLLRASTGIPYAGVLHGIEAWRIKSRLRVEGMRHADRLLAVSHFTRNYVVREHGIHPERISVFPNTYDAERFTPGPKPEHLLKKYGLSPDQPVLLTVSRLALSERYKGHWQVLIALRIIRQQIPNVHYLVVGTGDELAHLRAGVKMLGLEKNVTFTGFVATEDLPDHYRLCDAFVMPSTKEGFGIVFLEGAACGKPVIAGCLDGSFDAVDGGKLGILIDPHHPAQIADAVLSALWKTHENKLIFDPQALSRAVHARFGFDSFKKLLQESVRPLLTHSKERLSVSLPAFSEPPRLQPKTPRAPRIVVLTQLNSPYQVEFFNHVASIGDCHLEVIYLTHRDKNRQWAAPDIAHSHIILSETPHLTKNAMESLLSADLAVFNYYTDRFAWRAIRARAATREPWVFWGERPGFLQLGPPGMWFRRLVLMPLHRSKAPIWGVGQFGIEGYRVEFGSEHHYHNMPYYSELDRFHRCPRPQSDGARTILYSGSLTARKGADLLACAFAIVAAENPTVRLCLVGSGPLKDQMQSALKSCAERVEWAGFQHWKDLPTYYAKGDIFCLPSRYDGWGLALVEALASGLPAIATDQTGAAIDLIAPGQNGWLVKADDLIGLTHALREALAVSPKRLVTMQAAAKSSVSGQSVEEGARNFSSAAQQVIANWQHS